MPWLNSQKPVSIVPDNDGKNSTKSKYATTYSQTYGGGYPEHEHIVFAELVFPSAIRLTW